MLFSIFFSYKPIFIFSFLSVFAQLNCSAQVTTHYSNHHECNFTSMSDEEKADYVHSLYLTSPFKAFDFVSGVQPDVIDSMSPECRAIFNILKGGYYAEVKNDLDSTTYFVNQGYAISEANSMSKWYQGHVFIVNLMLQKGYISLAISYLEELIKNSDNDFDTDYFIYAEMSSIFSHLSLHEAAHEHLQKLEVMLAQNPSTHPGQQVDLFLAVAQNYQELGMYNEANQYFAQIDSMLLSNSQLEPLILPISFAKELIRSERYYDIKDIKNAQLSLNKLKEISSAMELNLVFRTGFMVAEGKYYCLTGEYQKALPLFEKVIDVTKKQAPAQTVFIIDVTDAKIESLRSMGQFKEALATQTDLMQYKDSIYKQHISTLPFQVAKLSETHQLKTIKLEREKDQAVLERSRIIIVALVFAFMLLSVILYIIRQNLKKVKNKNKILVKLYNELVKQKNIFKEKFLSSSKDEEVELTLYQKAEMYIEQNQAYKDSNLNRATIALALGTNEKYVAKAIREMTGKSFVEFINQYRLEYARNRLLENLSEPVKVILRDAGFSSEASFYRLFKDAYGMSSSEMRDAKEQLEKEELAKKEEKEEE